MKAFNKDALDRFDELLEKHARAFMEEIFGDFEDKKEESQETVETVENLSFTDILTKFREDFENPREGVYIYAQHPHFKKNVIITYGVVLDEEDSTQMELICRNTDYGTTVPFATGNHNSLLFFDKRWTLVTRTTKKGDSNGM